LPPAEARILAVNPGSTSTKFAVFERLAPVLVKNVRHEPEELEPFRGRTILDQSDFRAAQIEGALAAAGQDLGAMSAVVGRGGLLRPLASGTYLVTETMLDELRRAERGEHASNLGAFLASRLAAKSGARAFVVDPVSVDEWPERARLSGSPLLTRPCFSHALNTKAVAKRFARETGKPYPSLRLVVVHAGSGISVSAHADGRMIDVNNTREEGPFSTERAGGVPVMELVDLCFCGKYTRKEVETLLFREGGLQAYLGTKDLQEVERRIDAGDAKAALVFEAMLYQIAKQVGAMAAALEGRVDAILLTGGMAHSARFSSSLSSSVEWIAPVAQFPGEEELLALAEGALRVLDGEEAPRLLAHASVPAPATA
jgi:butyrate kinase